VSRAKRFTTIVNKLPRELVKLADMADVGSVRAVVDSRAEVDTLVEQLHEELAVRRVRD
jgi:(p)ppGpp synthase/HD superfamily hydrolase